MGIANERAQCRQVGVDERALVREERGIATLIHEWIEAGVTVEVRIANFHFEHAGADGQLLVGHLVELAASSGAHKQLV